MASIEMERTSRFSAKHADFGTTKGSQFCRNRSRRRSWTSSWEQPIPWCLLVDEWSRTDRPTWRETFMRQLGSHLSPELTCTTFCRGTCKGKRGDHFRGALIACKTRSWIKLSRISWSTLTPTATEYPLRFWDEAVCVAMGWTLNGFTGFVLAG